MKKICPKCNKEFLVNYPNNNQKYCSQRCSKTAQKEYEEQYRKRHPELKIYWKNYRKKYYQLHKIEILEQKKIYRKKHKTELSQKATIYKRKWRKNPINKLLNNLRSRIWDALKGKTKSRHTTELIGCSIDYLKIHLEKQFTKGMNWSNYGMNGWVVDHIIPCVSFNLSKKSEQLKCFNYNNLQPLWVEDNYKKGGRI